MRKFIRILAGITIVGAFVFVAPSAAWADHDSPDGTGHPCNPGTDAACTGTDAYHEEMPDIPTLPSPAGACAVTGTVTINVDTMGGPQHTVAGGDDPIWGNPSHSHYVFNEGTVLECASPGLVGVVEHFDVDADGGNDGHMLDVVGDESGLMAGNTDPIELDPLDTGLLNDVDPGPCSSSDGSTGDDHDFNDHHGSVNESAWSNSSMLSDAQGGPGGANCNKGDITVTGGSNTGVGWVKYIRIGPMVHAWGTFTTTTPAANMIKAFTALLVFTPTADPVTFLLNGVAELHTTPYP